MLTRSLGAVRDRLRIVDKALASRVQATCLAASIRRSLAEVVLALHLFEVVQESSLEVSDTICHLDAAFLGHVVNG